MASFAKLLVADVEVALRFYAALGFVQDGTDGVFVHLRWQNDAHLYLVKTPPGMKMDGKKGMGVLLGFSAINPDLAAVHQLAVNLGAPVEGPRITPWHTQELVVTDPDGYRLNFAQPG
jgi:catechol 2,3-dioxygenase-like lactoylglutathione lyase family enzyme